MTSRKSRRTPKFSRFGKVQTAIFDALIDGSWIPTEAVLGIGVANATHAPTPSKARSTARNDLMIACRSGRVEKRDGKHRLVPDFAEHWREHRGMATVIVRQVDPAKERCLGGWAESAAWQQSPLQIRDQIHFRPTFAVDLKKFKTILPAHATARIAGDGQHLVDCSAGTAPLIGKKISAWLDENGHHHEGVRIEHGLRRRDLNDLPIEFLQELCRVSFPPAKSRLNANMSSLRLLVSEQADVDQLIRLWILEAAAKFDANKGVPFGGYLSTVLPKWVHDLNRASHGRTAVDHELRHQRALVAFVTEHHRQPTEAELAVALGFDLPAFRKNRAHLANLAGLRQQQPLDVAESAGYEPAAAEDTAEEVLDGFEQTRLSQALVQATLGDTPETDNEMGVLVMYLTCWDEWTKSDLAKAGHTSVRSLNVKAALAEEQLRQRLADRAPTRA